MLNYNLPINNSKKYSNLMISIIEPVTKINLRGKKRDFITKIGKSLSIIPPIESNTSSANENLNLIWLSPDEWMLYAREKIYAENDIYKLEDELYKEISKVNYGSVTNITDHWVMINLKGENVYDLLSTSCPFDFNKFKSNKGSVVQTIFNHIDVIIHHKNTNDLNLFVRRSFSQYLLSWMNDAASRINPIK